MRRLKEGSQGVIILEATWVMLILCSIMMIMVAIGIGIYQKCVLTIVADETAYMVSQNYTSGKMANETVDQQNFKFYRYMFGNEDKLVDSAQTNAEKYVNERLQAFTFAGFMKTSIPYVNVSVQSRAYGVRFVNVRIDVAYDVLFMNLLMGDEWYVISATGEANCTDLSAMANGLTMTKKLYDKLDDNIVTKMFSLISTISKLFG